MGVVYLADDLRLERRVAVKVLPDAIAGDRDRRERLIREARAAAALEIRTFVPFTMPAKRPVGRTWRWSTCAAEACVR